MGITEGWFVPEEGSLKEVSAIISPVWEGPRVTLARSRNNFSECS